MASKRFWLIIIIVFSFLFILGISSGGECQIIGWRSLREKDNLNLQLKMVGCFLENREYQKGEEKLGQIKEKKEAGENSFLSGQVKIYESRLRSLNPQKREGEILFWKQRVVANPSYPDAWVSLGLLWYQQGDEQKAKLAMNKACALSPAREDIKKAATQLGFLCK